MRRTELFWAIVLLGGGSLLLLNNLDIVDLDFGIVFALILILAGVFTLFGRASGSGRSSETVVIPLEGAQSARVSIEHGAGRVHISGRADPGALVSGTFHQGISYQTDVHGDEMAAKLSLPGADFFYWAMPWNWGGQRSWDFNLSAEVPISLRLATGASDNHLNLESLMVRDLKLETGASSTEIVLPKDAGHTNVEIESGAASVDIRIPEGVAARIEAEAGLASININQDRFPRSGGLYQSPDFAESANKADIKIETGVSSITVS